MFIAIINRSYEEEVIMYKGSKDKEHIVEEAILGFVKGVLFITKFGSNNLLEI
jgi:hypothetical protein